MRLCVKLVYHCGIRELPAIQMVFKRQKKSAGVVC